MSEIYEYCYKIYRNLVHILKNLATQLEKSKIISTKEKNIHKPCIIIVKYCRERSHDQQVKK